MDCERLMVETNQVESFLSDNCPPMSIYETLYAFRDSFGKFMGTEGTHPWSQGFPLTTPLEKFDGPSLPPSIDVTWEGKKTILRNFVDFPKALRREPNLILQYLSKEFAVPADRVGDKAIFVGKRDPDDFTRLFGIYLKDYVECPTCHSPDTKVEKENRVSFLICEACGAKSTIKGKYA